MCICIKVRNKFLIVLVGIGLIHQANALPQQCIQAPERYQACPHVIYKRAALDIPVLQVKKNEVICLCLSDLKLSANKNKSKLDEIDQQVTLERISKKYQISPEELQKLVKY